MTGGGAAPGAPPAAAAGVSPETGGVPPSRTQITSVEEALAILEQHGRVSCVYACGHFACLSAARDPSATCWCANVSHAGAQGAEEGPQGEEAEAQQGEKEKEQGQKGEGAAAQPRERQQRQRVGLAGRVYYFADHLP